MAASPRMRTAVGVLEEIKAQDPNTEIKLHYIRQLISSGKVPCTLVGRKKLVNVDAVVDYIAKGTVPQEVQPTGQIRRVEI